MKKLLTCICLIQFFATISVASVFFDDNPDHFFKPYSRKVKGTFQISLKESPAVSANDPYHFWWSLPRDTNTQRLIGTVVPNTPPTQLVVDLDHGNQIAYWNFAATKELNLKIDFELEVNNRVVEIDPQKVGQYDKASREYQLYTRDEPLCHVTPEIEQIAKEIQSQTKSENPFLLSRTAFVWVLDHMVYAQVPELKRERGIDALLSQPFELEGRRYFKGDCGEYSFLYNAIMKALGIPSRLVVGTFSTEVNRFHAWSEILIPGYGWIPVDTSVADSKYDEGQSWNNLGFKNFAILPAIKDPLYFFGNIDPFRFVVSVGSDFKISPQPKWDFSSFLLNWLYHDGSVGIMQFGVFNLFLNSNLEIRVQEE